MYKCERCNSVSEAGEKENREVVQARPKTYPAGPNGKIGYGHETVRERRICKNCAKDNKE